MEAASDMQTLEIDVTDEHTAVIRGSDETISAPADTSIFNAAGAYAIEHARLTEREVSVKIYDTSGNRKDVVVDPDGGLHFGPVTDESSAPAEAPVPSGPRTVPTTPVTRPMPTDPQREYPTAGGGMSIDDTREMPRVDASGYPVAGRAWSQPPGDEQEWARAIDTARQSRPTPPPADPRAATSGGFSSAARRVGDGVTGMAGGARRGVSSRRGRRIAIATGFIGIFAAVVVVGVMALFGGSSDSPSPTAIPAQNTPAVSAAPTPPADADCPNRTDGAVTTGRDAGNTTSGAGVIKAFDFAYYVTRSGSAVRATATATANLGTPETIQATIDSLPAGTTHCLRIEDKGAGLYAVTLTQQAPGTGAPTVYQQQIQTAVINGRTLIAAIPQNDKVTTG